MTDEEARVTFQRIRWAETSSEPHCPKCGCLKVYDLATRPVWKCSACRYQFSVAAGTIFENRKRPIRDYLLAIAIFASLLSFPGPRPGRKGRGASWRERIRPVAVRVVEARF